MASAAKRRSKGSKASDGKKKRRFSGSDEEGPSFLSSKYAEPPTSKIYNSRFNHNQPAELFRKDLISAMKMADNEPLGAEDYWLIEDSWKPEWERGVQVPVYPEALPEPSIRILRKRSKEAHLKLPKKLLRVSCNGFFDDELHVMSYTKTLAERTCRYDMDDVDQQWLASVNVDRESFGLQPLEENFFEQVIDEFEDQAYGNFQEAIKSEEGLGVEYDEDAICDVCRSPDSLEGNELVFCDACNICVHQICYGITRIPEGSWICRTCALGIRPPCILCPNRGGAMKTARCGQKWAHVGCAVWIPEVSFLNFNKMEPIIKISQIPTSRWSLVCALCNEKTGVCITCNEKGCKTAFHVTCAFNEGIHMHATVRNTEEDTLKAFCSKHSRRLSVLSDSDEEDNIASKEKEALTNEKRANIRQQKIQEKEAEFYTYVNINEVTDIFQVDKVDIETIFYYWILKRKSNHNRPLLTPKIEDVENNCTEEDSPVQFLKRVVHHRQDLERARNLCYMVIKREKQTKRWYDMKEKIFIKQLEVLRKKGHSLTEQERQAVMQANDGGIAYDKKYSGDNAPSPNMVSVLTNLVGEKVPIHRTPTPKKIMDRRKTEPAPNPYAKHYLNGLAKRSQRWFPVAEKQLSQSDSEKGISNSPLLPEKTISCDINTNLKIEQRSYKDEISLMLSPQSLQLGISGEDDSLSIFEDVASYEVVKDEVFSESEMSNSSISSKSNWNQSNLSSSSELPKKKTKALKPNLLLSDIKDELPASSQVKSENNEKGNLLKCVSSMNDKQEQSTSESVIYHTANDLPNNVSSSSNERSYETQESSSNNSDANYQEEIKSINIENNINGEISGDIKQMKHISNSLKNSVDKNINFTIDQNHKVHHSYVVLKSEDMLYCENSKLLNLLQRKSNEDNKELIKKEKSLDIAESDKPLINSKFSIENKSNLRSRKSGSITTDITQVAFKLKKESENKPKDSIINLKKSDTAPRRGGLRGYKIPKKTRPEENAPKRGSNSPLSSLPNVTHVSPPAGYQSPTLETKGYNAPVFLALPPDNFQKPSSETNSYKALAPPANFQNPPPEIKRYNVSAPVILPPVTFQNPSSEIKRYNTPALAALPPVNFQKPPPETKCSWRTLEPRSENLKARVMLNGCAPSSERLVLKLKKNSSDCESPHWHAAEQGFNHRGWTVRPPPFQVRPMRPYHPPPVRWPRSRGSGYYHLNYRQGRFT